MKLTNLGEEFELWKQDFHGVKDNTRRFLEHLCEDKKKTSLVIEEDLFQP